MRLVPAWRVTMADVLYTEDDIARLLESPRFLAAVDAFALDKLPLGEAIARAAAERPLVPKPFHLLGYMQAIQEIAERIADQRLSVPLDVREAYRDLYEERTGSDTFWFSNDGAGALKFSELRRPEVK